MILKWPQACPLHPDHGYPALPNPQRTGHDSDLVCCIEAKRMASPSRLVRPRAHYPTSRRAPLLNELLKATHLIKTLLHEQGGISTARKRMYHICITTASADTVNRQKRLHATKQPCVVPRVRFNQPSTACQTHICVPNTHIRS